MRATVIGSGAWGTTLAKVLAENGHPVTIWSHDPAIATDINREHENKSLLPGISLPSTISCVTDFEEACTGKDLVLLVVASTFFQATVLSLKPFLGTDMAIVSATKGFDERTQKRMREVLMQNLPENLHPGIAVLSGPNISREIALQKPSTTVISSLTQKTAERVQAYFNNSYLRVYTNNDVIGTELGGTLKNVIAIAAGIVDGLALGDNAKSALMVRGLTEISRFAESFGARKSTLFGLSGMGDLITTCSSVISRNHFVGEHLGKGRKLPDILAEMNNVAEGVGTAKIVYEISREKGIDMPVTEQIFEVLFNDKNVSEAIADLMNRDTKSEA